LKVEVREEPITDLREYACIPIAFEVSRVFDVQESGKGRDEYLLIERPLAVPYLKDYDAYPPEAPAQWASQFDLSNWGLLVAWSAGRRVGGAAVAYNTPEISMLEGRSELAVLWDLRVSPEVRGKGVGFALLQAIENWARARGCRQLKVETQNVNVAACLFYARQGFTLAAVDRSAYPALPHEIQLLWYKNILPEASFSCGSRNQQHKQTEAIELTKES
jgi:GNAT superfamily N-acetyltransferase